MVLEIILTVAVIIGIMLLVGVPVETIFALLAVVLLGLIVLTMGLFSLFFVITDISLLFRKYVRGIFLRIDDSGRYDKAVYRVGDREYTCTFPAETVGRKKIYRKDNEYSLLIPRSEKRHYAYDRHSLMIIGIGTVFSVIFILVLVFGLGFFRTMLQ